MPDLLVPELVDRPFRDHYRELISGALERAAHGDATGRRHVEPRRRSLLRYGAPAVWGLAVGLLGVNSIAFGLESWPTGIADVGVLLLTAVWFAVATEDARARQVEVAAPPPEVREPEPEPSPEPGAPGPAAGGIAGVQVVPLRMRRDPGGHVTELLDDALSSPAGWQMVSCRAGTLRGMHAHARADGLRIVVQGRAALGLLDLRPGSPTERRTELLQLSGDDYCAVKIPAGVAHGIFALSDALVLVGAAATGADDELGCAWNDPGLGIDWPGEPQFLSERDRHAGPLSVLAAEVAQALGPQS